jgi:hypothetical protein
MTGQFNRRIFTLLTVAAAILPLPANILAQEFAPQRPYDGIQASEDAYHYHEAQRRANIDRQIATNEQLQWYRGVPNAYAGQYVYRDPPSLSFAYATGRRGIFGGFRQQQVVVTGDIFTPWAYIPGDIWGTYDSGYARQPIGRREVQTGPNRWESHPIYREEIQREPLEPARPTITGRREF